MGVIRFGERVWALSSDSALKSLFATRRYSCFEVIALVLVSSSDVELMLAVYLSCMLRTESISSI